MKLRAITLTNVRRFTDPARVVGIQDGLNVLSEPNEHGKSTLFDALQTLFFKPHGSRDKEVSSLRPHAGGAPEVSVELETPDGRFTVTKRWLQKPIATVHRDTTLIAQSDAAEAWIADLLGADAGGPSGLIWVRQGMTELTGGSSKEQRAALDARRDLMTSVGEEVESMTGGRRMDMALARCRDELGLYATATGRPRTGGPWKAAQDHVEDLITRRDALAATAKDLHAALSERTRARHALREWEAPEAVEDRRAKLEAALAAHAAAERHAEAIEAVARKRDMAQLTVDGTRSRLQALRETQTEKTEAAQQVRSAEALMQTRQATLETRRAERDSLERALDAAQQRLKDAEAARVRAQKAKAARDGAERRRDLETRIVQAEAARSAMETAAAAARSGPDAETLRRIEGLSAALAAAIAARDATVTHLVVRYAEGRDGAIRAGATPLPNGHPVPLPRATRLTIDGVGSLDIRPGEGAGDDGAVEVAADRLRKALVSIAAEDLDAARVAAASRAEARRQHGEAQAVFASLAPDGVDRLREALARIPQSDGTDSSPDPDTAEAAYLDARELHDTARIAFDAASESLADARTEAMQARTALTALLDRLNRADAALGRSGDLSEDDLVARVEQADAALGAAQAEHDRLRRDAPDLASTRAALTRAQSVDQRARDEITRLKRDLAVLDDRIARSAGDAVEERLAETEQELSAAQADLARIEHAVAVLTRLETALQTARSEARERYFAPIARELKPLLRLLWPEADLTWGEELLLPDALVRSGQEEPIDILSGGTQEQVALLVRLAFARLLAASGRVAPVILDDALVFTDDDRIERMFDALHRQADDLQIIVLTCRQRAFRNLGGNSLRLSIEPAATA